MPVSSPYTPTKDTSLIAKWTQAYTVNFEGIGEVAKITAYNETTGAYITNGSQVEEGNIIKFHIDLYGSHYDYINWAVNGVVVSEKFDDITVVITKNTNVIATADQYVMFTVNYSVVGNGTLISDDLYGKSGDYYREGTQLVFTATPAPGYHVSEWKLGDAVVDNPDSTVYTLNITKNTILEVTFLPIP